MKVLIEVPEGYVLTQEDLQNLGRFTQKCGEKSHTIVFRGDYDAQVSIKELTDFDISSIEKPKTDTTKTWTFDSPEFKNYMEECRRAFAARM